MSYTQTGGLALIAILAAAGLLRADVPVQDSRNTDIPNTDTHMVMPAYRTLAEWESRKAQLRKQILAATGLLPLPKKTPLNAVVFGRVDRQGYAIEKVYLQSMPGYYLCGNLYRPLGKAGKHPGLLIAHGHWQYGRLVDEPLASGPALGVNLALQGYVAFAYDMVGYNDTIQTPHAFGGVAEQLWSFGPLALQLWNSIRALDFLESLEDVDPANLGMTGASGGGTQTFLLTAVDDRVRYSAPVNMVSAHMQGGDVCENAPGLRVGTSNLEIAAMMAPRPMLLVSATGDWTKNVPQEEYPEIRAIYALYGRADAVESFQVDASHNYNRQSREAVYRFFGRRMLTHDEKYVYEEKPFEVEKLQDVLVFHGRTLPVGALTYDQVFSEWKDSGATGLDPDAARERLGFVLGAEWPARVESSVQGERIVLSRPGYGDRVPGIWLPGHGDAALVVHALGAEAARGSDLVQDLVKAGRSVLLIDCFQTGSAVAPRDRSHRFFLTFNRSDDANRVQDILTALAFLHSQQPSGIELVGIEKASVWSVFAAAVAPLPLTLQAETGWFRDADEQYVRTFFVPGIRRAGGIGAALAVIKH
jgi:dienelactone hydrolase